MNNTTVISNYFLKNSKQVSTRLLSIAISLLFFIISICSCYPIYETNDDNLMISILNSSLGDTSVFAVYINRILASLIIQLQKYFPFVCWYTLLLYTFTFIAFCSINYVLMNLSFTSLEAMAFIFLINFWGGYECYCYPQFTKIAGLCAIAGFFLINHWFFSEKKCFSDLSIGFVLMIFSSLVRFSSFGLACLIISSIGIYHFVQMICSRSYKKLLLYVIIFTLTLGCSLGLNRLSISLYHPTESWANYNTVNRLRSQLLDFSFPDYTNNQELYHQLNIYPEDLELFQNWTFADTEVFNLQALQLLVDAKNNNPLPTSTTYYIKELCHIIHLNAIYYLFCNYSEPTKQR